VINCRQLGWNFKEKGGGKMGKEKIADQIVSVRHDILIAWRDFKIAVELSFLSNPKITKEEKAKWFEEVALMEKALEKL
jgi:hypothetical protein